MNAPTINHPQPSPELWRLVGLMCDQLLTAEDAARLEVLLATDADAKRFCARYLDLHAHFLWLYRDEQPEAALLAELNGMNEKLASVAVTDPAAPDVRSAPTPSPTLSPPPREHSRAVWLSHWIANWIDRTVGKPTAALFGIGMIYYSLILLLFWGIGRVNPVDGPTERSLVESPAAEFDDSSTASTGSAVATVSTWSANSDRLAAQPPEPIAPGQPLQLTNGMAEVKFSSGAKVVVQGPANFEVRSDNSGFLRSGKLVAQVPDTAHGFTVHSAHVSVVDLGTAFAVEVSPDGTADVFVLEGRVRLDPTPSVEGSSDRSVAGFVLLAGQSRRITGDQRPLQEIPFEATRFSQSLVALQFPDSSTKPQAAPDTRYADLIKADKPVAYWRFERVVKDQILDESGNNLHATLRGTVRLVTSADRLGRAAEFRGGEDYAFVLDDKRLHFDSAITVECWLRQAKPTPRPAPTLSKGFVHGGWALVVADATAVKPPFEPGLPGFALNDIHGSLHSTYVADDRWRHVVSVWNGTHMWMVVDGVASEALPTQKPLANKTQPLTIGASEGFVPWIGMLDEVAIYNRGLTLEELERHRLASPSE